MHLVADRQGQIEEENSLQDRLLEWMYGHRSGRVMLRLLILPCVSKIGGKFLESRFSLILIPPFIKSHED